MAALSTILLISGGCGVVALLANWFTSRSGGKRNVMEAVHKITQKLGIEKIGKIESKQNIIKTNIEVNESIAEATKIKISAIQENAAAEINAVLKADNISKIHTVIDTEWGDI